MQRKIQPAECLYRAASLAIAMDAHHPIMSRTDADDGSHGFGIALYPIGKLAQTTCDIAQILAADIMDKS